MKLEYQDKSKEDWFLVSWTLSNKCNYRCNYCPDILHNGSTGHADWNKVENFISNFDIPGKEICYRISGGEPTYWKHFIDMAKLVKSKGHYFTFLTNASHKLSYYKEISQYTDMIMISYHPRYADANVIINIANEINIPIVLNLMMDPAEDFENLNGIAMQIQQDTDNVWIIPKLVVDKTSSEFPTNKVSDYSEEQMKWLNNWKWYGNTQLDLNKFFRGELLLDGQEITANDLIIKEKNKFKGWDCYAGLHGINIDMWGQMYRADCQYGGNIGNLAEYELPKDVIPCGKDICSCLSDIYIKKEQCE